MREEPSSVRAGRMKRGIWLPERVSDFTTGRATTLYQGESDRIIRSLVRNRMGSFKMKRGQEGEANTTPSDNEKDTENARQTCLLERLLNSYRRVDRKFEITDECEKKHLDPKSQKYQRTCIFCFPQRRSCVSRMVCQNNAEV